MTVVGLVGSDARSLTAAARAAAPPQLESCAPFAFEPWGRALGIAAGFVAILAAMMATVGPLATALGATDVAAHWPFSVLQIRLPFGGNPSWPVLLGAALLGGFCCGARRIVTARRLAAILAVGVAALLATNLLQGLSGGFVHPITGGTVQYYHDAVRIESPLAWLRRFNAIQADLLVHSRSHPPGAVLTIWALRSLLGNPAWIALAIGVVSSVLSGIFFHGLLGRFFEPKVCALMTALFLILPAVQIYYLASLDAVMATTLLGAVYFIGDRRPAVALAGTGCCLLVASFLTFAWVFVVPVLVGLELRRRRAWLLASVAVLVAGCYAMLQWTIGFDYLHALQTATSLENPAGFRLFHEPGNYFITRLEDICEIAAFFGPFLLLLAWRGIRALPRGSDSWWMMGLGLATLALMFATGAFRTGETARACGFIYPYLLIPVAAQVQAAPRSTRSCAMLLVLIFGQTIVMQALGCWFW